MPNAPLEDHVGSHTLRTAQGYYELGMISDCQSTLDQLPASEKVRPDGLELSILIALDAGRYEAALELCDTAIKLYPKAPFGYVNKAYTLHEMKRTPESLKVLEEAHLVVAVEPTAVYNRGCYLACLNWHAEPIFWVKQVPRAKSKAQTARGNR